MLELKWSFLIVRDPVGNDGYKQKIYLNFEDDI